MLVFSAYQVAQLRRFGGIVGLLLFIIPDSPAQQLTPDEYTKRNVFLAVEQPPEFPGGRAALYNYLKSNVQMPPEAVAEKITDRVIISFIVEPDGQLSDFEFVRSWGYGCDVEAMRVLKAMPRWKPGSQSGQLQRVQVRVAVLFGLDYPSARNP